MGLLFRVTSDPGWRIVRLVERDGSVYVEVHPVAAWGMPGPSAPSYRSNPKYAATSGGQRDRLDVGGTSFGFMSTGGVGLVPVIDGEGSGVAPFLQVIPPSDTRTGKELIADAKAWLDEVQAAKAEAKAPGTQGGEGA